MDPRFADDTLRRTPELIYALMLYQMGDFETARAWFSRAERSDASRDVASLYLTLIDRALAGNKSGGWTLNLPTNWEGLWEVDWLRHLFGGVMSAEVVDERTGPPADRSIIVDLALNSEKDAYYRRNFEAGQRQVLVHLGDEYFAESGSAYRWCERVYRVHWSPIHAGLSHVLAIPLGYKSGFASAVTPRPAGERPHLWSFVGDSKKSTRRAMLDAMRQLPGGFEHLTGGWDSADSLSTTDYRGVFDQSLFAPCPQGNASLDSFRVCEALEAGCIPIVERRPGYPYFDRLLPGHPMLTVSDWAEAPALVEALDAGARETLRRACQDWWLEHKRALIARIGADLA